MSEPDGWVDLTPYIVPGSVRWHATEPVDPGAIGYSPGVASTIREAVEALKAAPYEPDPLHRAMTEYLDRLAAAYDPGGDRLCPVEGCGWVLRVDPPVLVEVPPLGEPASSYSLRYVGAPREQVQWYLATHAEQHALNSETGLDVAAVVDPETFVRWDAP